MSGLLNRAVAFADVNRVAVFVGKDLHLDVTRLDQQFFDVDASVAESRLRLAARRFEAGGKIRLTTNDAHALAAAARRRLDDQRVACTSSERLGRFNLLDHTRARDDRDARVGHALLRARLIAHQRDRRRRRSYELEAVRSADFGKRFTLGEKPVAGMNRVDARDLCGADDVWYVEIRPRRLRRTDAVRFVRHSDVKRVAIRFGKDRDRPHAELAARSHDAQRNLAAVGD